MLVEALVETEELLETALYASLAGIGLALVFSLAIWGATRFADLSRDERPAAAGAAAALTTVALIACLAGVVIGIVVMAQK
jgi:hypothetical protein